MKRLDVALVEWGFVPSRNKAQEMIKSKAIELRLDGEWRLVEQASHNVEGLSPNDVRIVEDINLQFVSRGGLKLAGALDELQWDVRGWSCLDIGLSTGGFTDCLLQRGAKRVLGIDVGSDQVHEKLKSDPRLLVIERLHVRDAVKNTVVLDWIQKGLDLCVVDVSFIPLRKVLPYLTDLLPSGTKLLALMKPQFEARSAQLSVEQKLFNKKGVIRDEAVWAELCEQTREHLRESGFVFQKDFPSRLRGRDGNQEFFFYAIRS